MSEQIESQTITTTTATTPATDLSKVRDLIIKTTPNVVPELVQGVTVDELVGSVDRAVEAYNRIAEQMRPAHPATSAATAPAQAAAAVTPPAVPGGATVAVPLSEIPTMDLIRRGLSELKSRSAR